MIELSRLDASLFSESYRRVLGQAGISEDAADYKASPPPLRERVIRCVWFDQTLVTDRLRTDDGSKLRVLTPGWWNLEAGPDFRNAAIRLAGGPVVKGDVEVHLRTSGWHAHGHDSDPAYNGVVLHVVLWNDRGAATVRTAAGKDVPQLTMEPYLRTPISELTDDVDPAEYPEAADATSGRCHELLVEGKVTFEWLERFLDHAGDQRILQKARRFAQGEGHDDDQALYEGIAECLGYKRNKVTMRQLARSLPLGLLRERVGRRPEAMPAALAVEALLYGAAGLLPRSSEGMDERAADHLAAVRSAWEALGSDLGDNALDPAQWSFDGTRPSNFPTRRLAALSALVTASLGTGLNELVREALGPAGAGRLPPRQLSRRRAQFLDLFLSLHDPFWSTRSRYRSKPSAKPSRLVGTDRAHTIVIDCILPALLYQARRDSDRALEELLHQLYAAYPKLPSTSITRFMALRLFGRPESELKLLRSARRQQGLYQIYTDFCDSEAATCARCPLVRLLEA